MPESRSGDTAALPPNLLLLGASTRACAFSALRAGLRPICADLFADEDLRAVADVRRVADYPRGLLAAARSAPHCPWMYTGALENQPRLIAELSAVRPLLGNPAGVVRRVRDPFRVFEVLQAAEVPVLAVRSPADPPPADGNWMLKPRRSAAGRGIRIWDHRAKTAPTLGEAHYFQQRIGGKPISAIFLADAGKADLAGITRQFVGLPELHAPPFAYCGSIGPLDLPDHQMQTLRRTASVLVEQFALRGLFGCDFLLDRDTPWLTEINPRYTASVEIIEHALARNLLRPHVDACGPSCNQGLPARPQDLDDAAGSTARPRIVAKAILFAPQEFVVPHDLASEAAPLVPDLPPIADVPRAGMFIAAGHPVCTVLAAARDWPACLLELRGRVQTLNDRLFPGGAGGQIGKREGSEFS